MNPSIRQSCTLVHVMTVPQSLAFFHGQVGFMKEHGLDVRVVTSPGEPLQEFGLQEHVPVYAVEMPRRVTPLRDLLAVLQLWLLLRRIRPTIVHAHTPKGGLLGTLAAWLNQTPLRVYHIRGLPFMTATGFRRALLWWTERISCLLAHQVLCVSHSLREVAIQEGICPPHKIKVLLGGSGNGVDAMGRFNANTVKTEHRQRIRNQHRIPREALVVGFVGRVVRDKGMTELAEAWASIREEFPEAHLLVVGEDEPQDPVPPDVMNQMRSDPRVHLVGPTRDVAPFYAAMDLLTLPTYREGFPNVLLEAMAMALPVVATRIPGCVDAVVEGETGLLVPPKDARALADGLRQYLRDDLSRWAHGEAGRKRALRDFRREAIWAALYEEYERLLRERGLSCDGPVRSPADSA